MKIDVDAKFHRFKTPEFIMNVVIAFALAAGLGLGAYYLPKKVIVAVALVAGFFFRGVVDSLKERVKSREETFGGEP